MTGNKITHRAHAQGADTAEGEADGGPVLDAADRAAERKLAEGAGLVAARRAAGRGTFSPEEALRSPCTVLDVLSASDVHDLLRYALCMYQAVAPCSPPSPERTADVLRRGRAFLTTDAADPGTPGIVVRLDADHAVDHAADQMVGPEPANRALNPPGRCGERLCASTSREAAGPSASTGPTPYASAAGDRLPAPHLRPVADRRGRRPDRSRGPVAPHPLRRVLDRPRPPELISSPPCASRTRPATGGCARPLYYGSVDWDWREEPRETTAQ
ncbi:hypothetical protein ACWGQ5_49470 [Streptomyces sp. NPDC055722]